MSILQILISSMTLFILYKFIIVFVGIEKLGIWSLVFSLTSVAQIAQLGIPGSIVKFVAKYAARNEPGKVSSVIQTATTSSGLFIVIAILISYPLFKWFLKFIIPQQYLLLANTILPLSLFSLLFASIANIFLSGLDGLQRIDIRSIIMTSTNIIFLLLSLVAIPKYGLIGLSVAKVIQGLITLIISWCLLKKFLTQLPAICFKYDSKTFREIIVYGANFQIMGICSTVYEAVVKTLLSKFAGLASVGYYEMANRLIQQFRSFIIAINQVLVPTIAKLHETVSEKVKTVYIFSYELMLYLALPFFSALILCLPIISKLWIGYYEKNFVIFGMLLCAAWLINTLATPAYFSNLGIGKLKWNVITHISTVLIGLFLGTILGRYYSGIGVIFAAAVSLIISSCILCLAYHLEHKISLSKLIPKDSTFLVSICFIALPIWLLCQNIIENTVDKFIFNTLAAILFLIVISIFMWVHPMRKRISAWIICELSTKNRGGVEQEC